MGSSVVHLGVSSAPARHPARTLEDGLAQLVAGEPRYIGALTAALDDAGVGPDVKRDTFALLERLPTDQHLLGRVVRGEFDWEAALVAGSSSMQAMCVATGRLLARR